MSASEKLAALDEAMEYLGSVSVGVTLSDALPAIRAVIEANSELADLAATAVTEPRRFHENIGEIQQRLGQAVAKSRLTDRALDAALPEDAS